MAQLFFEALKRTGLDPELASEFRSFCPKPDRSAFEALAEEGEREAERIIEDFSSRPLYAQPRLWFTYHLYYKAPDHIGPRVAAALGIPYVVAEASRSPRRMQDDWSLNASYAEAGIDLADVILFMTERDFPALASRPLSKQRLIPCAPFIDPGRKPTPKARPRPPYRLATVAMMRYGDKLASYQMLAEALSHVNEPLWTLDIVGDGPARAEVEALFAKFAPRVRFKGRIDDAEAMRAAYHDADIFVWPGVGEAFGMTYLEAKSMETPVVAEDRPGVRDVLRGGGARLAPPNNPQRFAATIDELLADPDSLLALGRGGRADVIANRSLDAQAEKFWTLFDRLELIDLSDIPRPSTTADIVALDCASLN